MYGFFNDAGRAVFLDTLDKAASICEKRFIRKMVNQKLEYDNI